VSKPHFSKLPGGNYPARQNDDGTWDIQGVPVFSVIAKGIKGAPRDITRDDLVSAVETHRRKFAEDRFLARVNVLHNFGVHRPTPAGFFLPTDVLPFRMGGKVKPVIFADLLSVPDETFRAIDRDELPYCSVEVRTYEPLTFGALALLDTEPPFFEFPLISFGSKEYAQLATVPDDGAVAVARFHFREDAMPDEEKPKDEKPEGQMEAGDGEGDLKSAIAAIEAKMKEFVPLLELLPKLQEMLSGAGAEEEKPEGDGPVNEPVSALKANEPVLLGRIAALEQFKADSLAEKIRDRLFSAAVGKLEADGYSLADEPLSILREAAAKGQESLDLVVKSFRQGLTQDPPSDFGAGPSSESWPAEVMQYAHQSPEMFSAAKEAYRGYLDLKQSKAFGADLSPLDAYMKREVG